MKLTENLCDNLKIMRKLYRFTQTQMAKTINTSRSCISNYESGCRQPDSKTLTLIADVYNVSLDYLLGRSPVKTIFRNKTVLAQTYEAVEKAQSEQLLDMSDSPVRIKCAVMDFYTYLSEKESVKKK